MRSLKQYGGNANVLPIEYFGGASNQYNETFGNAPPGNNNSAHGTVISEGFAGPDLNVYENYKATQVGGYKRRRRRTKRTKKSIKRKKRKSQRTRRVRRTRTRNTRRKRRSYRKNLYGGNANTLPLEYFGGNSGRYDAQFGNPPVGNQATSHGMPISEGFAGPDLNVYEGNI